MKAALAATAVSLAALAGCPRAPETLGATACESGLVMLGGACIPLRLAEQFCGRASTPRPGGGCARTACAPGEALDLEHGICLPQSSVYLTLLHGQPRDEDDTRIPTCRDGRMTSRNGRLACAKGPRSCGRGERFVPTADAAADVGACEMVPVCGAGEMYDAQATHACVRLVRGGALDVGTWARLAIGTDGGEGTNAFCAPVRAAMLGSSAFGVDPAHFQVRLVVPDNDVTQASSRLVARPGTPTVAADAAERSLEELVEMLRFHGGTALAASVSLDVSCSAPLSPEPTLELPR